MRRGLAGLMIGVVFGVMLSWSGMSSPNVIREALLFQSGYLYLFMFSAVATATAGQAILRAARRRTVFYDKPITRPAESLARHHIAGAALFGVGWGLADVCPGPIATQLGQGIAWSLFILAGVVIGINLYLRTGARETEPATDPVGATPEPALAGSAA